MRKEPFIVILIGIFIGLLIAFGIWRANSALNGTEKKSPFTLTRKEETKPTTKPEELTLTLNSPTDFEVYSTTTALVSGLTKPGSTVVISAESKDYFTKVPENGAFETQVEISEGLNQLVIYSFDERNETSKKIMLIRSSQFGSTEEEDKTLAEKVSERLNDAKSKALAYTGTITDKTDNSLQIKNVDGAIQILAISEGATYGQGLSNPKELKYQDIAIGDYIVAMGFADSKGVLKTRRVVVTNPFIVTTRKAVSGSIDSISKKTVVLVDKKEIAWNLVLPTKWVGPDIKQLNIGKDLFAVGEPETDKPENIKIRTISFEPEVSATPTQALSGTPSPTPKNTATPRPSPRVTN